jgi:hypothetical protein
MSKYIYLLFITTSFITVLGRKGIAQSKEVLAKSEYLTAEEAYEKKQYLKSLDHLDKAEKHWGQKAPRFQYLKVKSFFELKKYDESETEINIYFDIASEEDAGYIEMVKFLSSIKDAKEKARIREHELAKLKAIEDADWNRAQKENTLESYSLFLKKHPNSRYKKEITKITAPQVDSITMKIFHLTKEAESNYQISKTTYVVGTGGLILGTIALSSGIIGLSSKENINTVLTSFGLASVTISALAFWKLHKSGKDYNRAINEKKILQEKLDAITFETRLELNSSGIGFYSTFGKGKKQNPVVSPF